MDELFSLVFPGAISPAARNILDTATKLLQFAKEAEAKFCAVSCCSPVRILRCFCVANLEVERHKNMLASERATGEPLQFGSLVQLRHCRSGKFVSLMPGEQSPSSVDGGRRYGADFEESKKLQFAVGTVKLIIGSRQEALVV